MGLLARIKQFLIDGVVGPSRSVRRRHIPILGTYFGYGALGLTAVAELHWLKRDAEFTPAELAVLSIWLALPWSIKMVFGLLVDSLPIARSTRRSWLLVGSAMIAAGLLLNAAAYSHSSLAIRDALLAVRVPFVEVHLTDPSTRPEAARRQLVFSDLAVAVVTGKGPAGYCEALQVLVGHLRGK